MKQKNPQSVLRLILILALLLFSGAYIAQSLLIRPNELPIHNAKFFDVFENCGIETSDIQSIEYFGNVPEISKPQLSAFFDIPIAAQIFSSQVELGHYLGVQYLNTGVTNRQEMPQIMYFENHEPNYRLFIKVFRTQNEAGYCGTFEIIRAG